jgi:serpin B
MKNTAIAVILIVISFFTACGDVEEVSYTEITTAEVQTEVSIKGSETSPVILINDTPIDTTALVYNDIAYVPVRGVFERLGYKVEYLSDRNAVQVLDVHNNSPLQPVLYCTSEKISFFDENHTEKAIDGTLLSADNAMYLPINVLTDAFGIDIEYKAAENEVVIKTADGSTEPVTEEATIDNSSFAYALNELMPNDENYVFSPLALRYSLALAASGGNGTTKSEILNVLGIGDVDEYGKISSNYTMKYANGGSLGFCMADGIWLNDDHAVGAVFTEDFAKTAVDNFNAEVNNSDNNNVVKDINAWCKNNTDGKVTNLIDTNEFLLYAISAVYFNGKWQQAFSEENTYWETFTSRPGNRKHVPLMHTVGNFRYYEDDSIKIVSLPYDDGSVSFYAVLSNDKPFRLEDYTDKMQVKRVDVKIPKFKTDFGRYMKPYFTQMGIKTAFDSMNSDIPSIIENDGQSLPAYFTDVVHRTYFQTDEEGVGTTTGSQTTDETTYTFHTTSPFTYMVRDNSNGEILIMGEYAFAKY